MHIEVGFDSLYELEQFARLIVLGVGTGCTQQDIETEAEKAAREVLQLTEKKISLKQQVDEAIEKDRKDAEAPARKSKADKFDYGKLRALLKGGWSIPKISDEMGESDEAILTRIRRMEEGSV